MTAERLLLKSNQIRAVGKLGQTRRARFRIKEASQPAVEDVVRRRDEGGGRAVQW